MFPERGMIQKVPSSAIILVTTSAVLCYLFAGSCLKIFSKVLNYPLHPSFLSTSCTCFHDVSEWEHEKLFFWLSWVSWFGFHVLRTSYGDSPGHPAHGHSSFSSSLLIFPFYFAYFLQDIFYWVFTIFWQPFGTLVISISLFVLGFHVRFVGLEYAPQSQLIAIQSHLWHKPKF